jgi:hypothetical protein
MHLFAIFLLAVTGTGIGLIGDHNLMHQCFVEFATEQRIRCGHGGCGLALGVNQFKFHVIPALSAP